MRVNLAAYHLGCPQPAMPAALYPSPKTLLPAVRAALHAWHTVGGAAETLLEGLLLVHERRTHLPADLGPANLRRATNELLLTGLNDLALHDERGATILRARFLDADKAQAVASRLHLSRDSVNRLQSAALRRLADLLWAWELALRQERAAALEAHLPPAQYLELFGLHSLQSQLVKQLLKPQAPWVLALVGIGGIGKTALADAAARQVLGQFRFEQVVWIRADTSSASQLFERLLTQLADALWPNRAEGGTATERQQRLRQALKAQPYLIIIDNLETQADFAYLSERFTDWASPSKFLCTSRARLTGTSAVFSVMLDELPQASALELLRQQALSLGQTDLAHAPAAQLQPIYRVVGGNPLALRLVVGLTPIHPLPQILADLQQSRPGQIEDLYRHIYWKAWQTLTPPARALLQAMPLIAEPGALPEQLRAIGQLSDDQLWPAIAELAARSLLEVRGTAWERRYGLHRLTETFLRTDIIHWPNE